MVLSWVAQPQVYKSQYGYYLNHDNLILANAEQRKKLIFYFVASQTPEKLNPADSAEFFEARQNHIEYPSLFFGTVVALYTGYKIAKDQKFSWKKNLVRNYSKLFGGAILVGALGMQLVHQRLEPHFVENSKLVDQLTNKYNLTVFDFALAKKESHLKSLKDQLTFESLTRLSEF